MLGILAFQLQQIFNQNLIFFSKWHVYKQPLVISTFESIS